VRGTCPSSLGGGGLGWMSREQEGRTRSCIAVPLGSALARSVLLLIEINAMHTCSDPPELKKTNSMTAVEILQQRGERRCRAWSALDVEFGPSAHGRLGGSFCKIVCPTCTPRESDVDLAPVNIGQNDLEPHMNHMFNLFQR
jgi:hypothetical protein